MRVLHSTRAAGSETKYATHMAATAGEDIEVSFFSWPRALFGRYDLFHLHWPEALVGDRPGRRAAGLAALSALLYARLRLTRTPVVYTLHNGAPHDGASPRQLRARERFERLADVEIHLVPEPGRVTGAEAVSIPHGSYIEPYASHPRAPRTPGRILFFGLIRPYKGVEELLAAFAALPATDATLRLAGKPMDPSLQSAIEKADAADARVSHRFGFLPDRELAAEVTAAQLVVLPYRELHSSGVVLVALSLNCPVLIPDSATGRALQAEVGAGWVHLFGGPLTPAHLDTALAATATPPAQVPDLSGRSWDRVRAAHAAVYRRAVARKRGARRA